MRRLFLYPPTPISTLFPSGMMVRLKSAHFHNSGMFPVFVKSPTSKRIFQKRLGKDVKQPECNRQFKEYFERPCPLHHVPFYPWLAQTFTIEFDRFSTLIVLTDHVWEVNRECIGWPKPASGLALKRKCLPALEHVEVEREAQPLWCKIRLRHARF